MYLTFFYLAFIPSVYGVVNRIENSSILDIFTKYYDENKIDMPADYLEQMANVEATVGLVQLEKYHDIVNRRRFAASYYNEKLKDLKTIKVPPIIPGATYSHYIITTNNREDLIQFAAKRNVNLGYSIEYCIPYLPIYKKILNCQLEFPVAKRLSETVVNLPMWLRDTSLLKTVTDIICDFDSYREIM